MTDDDVTAEDAGTITCTVTISGVNYASEPFTLRISGERLVYCVIACIVYCKQCMLLLLATCYLYYTSVVMVIMYRGMFTVGVAVTRVNGSNNAIVSANAIDDYSYINAREGAVPGQIARCVTGLGPIDTNDNSDIGEVFFNRSSIPFAACTDGGSATVQPRPATDLNSNVGVINMVQCRAFSTTVEGIYTCTMINSSMVEQSVRFGVYFTGRSE